MAAKRERFCLMCHQVGIMITFETGNALRRHVRDRHPMSKTDIARKRIQLRQYRKEVLLKREQLYRRD